MTHQVIAFKQSMRREAANTASTPLSSISGHRSPVSSNRTVALAIALRYLAARDRIPDNVLPDIRKKQSMSK